MPAPREPYISKSNRRGVLLLLVIILVIVFIPRVLTVFFSREYTLSSSELFIAEQVEEEGASQRDYYPRYRKKKRFKLPGKAFDPNTYVAGDWMALGLSQKQADVVVRFSARGIRNYEEFNRITVIPEELKVMIKDSLIFPIRQTENFYVKKPEEKKRPLIELNTASTDALIELPGIGEYTASKIIQYRDRIGGFVRTEQLMEIKKIDPELYARLDKLITVDASVLKKININSADLKTIKSHPYFDYHIANSIVKMRQQRGGKFLRIDEILESELIDHELFEKIKPYLTL